MNFNQPVESNKDVKVNQEFTNKSTLNFKLPAYLSLGFPGDSVVKNLPAMQEKIGRAHVWTPVTSVNLVCRLLLEKNFFNDTATTEIYTLSLHDALPI